MGGDAVIKVVKKFNILAAAGAAAVVSLSVCALCMSLSGDFSEAPAAAAALEQSQGDLRGARARGRRLRGRKSSCSYLASYRENFFCFTNLSPPQL